MKINTGTTVSVTGYVGQEPEVKPTAAGNSYVSMRVAVSPKKDVTEWYRVIAWGELGEAVEKSIKKGAGILVKGHLRQWTTKPKPPNKYGQDVIEIVAKKVGIFLDENEVSWLYVKGGEKV